MNIISVYLLFLLSHLDNRLDTVIIRKDPRLDILTQKQYQYNKRVSLVNVNGQFKGYRVQFSSTTNREEAMKIKSDILSRFPEEKAYLFYSSPYFKVRIGNFIKREEADKFRKILLKFYAKSVYVVEDDIEYTFKEGE